MKKNIFNTLIFWLGALALNAQTLSVSNTQLNFGVVYDGAPDSLQLTISNNLSKTVNVTGLKFYTTYGQPAFSCSTPVFSIASGASQTVWIKFAPLHNINHNSELIIENDAERGFISVDLRGQGRYSNTYYNASENLEEEVLKTTLKSITGAGYVSLGYNGARDQMYMSIDNQKTNGQGATQNTLECVYTGRLAVGYTSRTDCQTNDNFNTEHTFPQGFFNSANPMLSDLHHLFPTDNTANSTRGNYPFGTATTTSWTVGGSIYDGVAQVFEPRDQQKGATARAMLYFVMRYQNYANFMNSQEAILKTWNHTFLPTVVEQNRNNAIYALQNNRNPFVDYPQLADRITSFSNTSVAPSTYIMDVTQPQINYGWVKNGTATNYNFVLVNNGNQVLQLTNFSLSNTAILSFTNGNPNANLNPGEALNIGIDLTTLTLGGVNELLTFTTNIPGMTADTIPIVAWSSVTGLNEASPKTILLYPNPATDHLIISNLAEQQVVITNTLGQEFLLPSTTSNNELYVNISKLTKGIYFIATTTESKLHWHDVFIKQ